MSEFDPWRATAEQAAAQPDAYKSPDGAFFQFAAAQQINQEKERVVNGTGFDVLQAVAACAIAGLVMPDWLARAYLRRYRAVSTARADSWDAPNAFGKPYKKGTQVAALKRRRENRMVVVNFAHESISMNPEQAIDNYFWERIGEATGEGKTNAQKLFSEAVRMGFTYPLSEQKETLLKK